MCPGPNFFLARRENFCPGGQPRHPMPLKRTIWIEARPLDKLAALRGPGESYSDVILRLTELEARQGVSPSA